MRHTFELYGRVIQVFNEEFYGCPNLVRSFCGKTSENWENLIVICISFKTLDISSGLRKAQEGGGLSFVYLRQDSDIFRELAKALRDMPTFTGTIILTIKCSSRRLASVYRG